MQRFLLLLLAVAALIVAACQTPNSTSQAVSASSAAMATEGTIVNVEEGYLLLDLSDGTRKEIGTNEAVVPMDALISAQGRRCRVHYRPARIEEIDGSVRTALFMTRFEWL